MVEVILVANAQGGVATSTDLSNRFAELSQQGSGELKAEWRRLFRSEPPRLSRDLLLRAVAHRMQEQAFGGHSKAVLRELAGLLGRSRGEWPAETVSPTRPGSRLIREWRGRTHTVVVTESGFEYAGATYVSLTPIAQVITGAHWSGPRFFGLKRRQTTGSAATNRSPEKPTRRSSATPPSLPAESYG